VAASDYDSDGLGDLVIGVPGRTELKAGLVSGLYIVSGAVLDGGEPISLLVEDGVATMVGAGQGEGEGMLALPDVDGDGLDDLIVTAPGGGVLYLLPGSSVREGIEQAAGGAGGYTDLVSHATAWLVGDPADAPGEALAVAPTPDGGYGLLIGSPSAAGDDGEVALWSIEPLAGEVSLGHLSDRFLGADAQRLGFSVAALGADAGGEQWLGVGAPFTDPDYEDAGAVYALPMSAWFGVGTYDSAVEDAAWSVVFGEDAYGEFGLSVSGLEDLDGDGFPELVGGVPRVDRDGVGFDVGGAAIWLEAFGD